MSAKDLGQKAALIEQIVDCLKDLTRQAPVGDWAAFEIFVRHYYAHVAPQDMIRRTVGRLAHGVLSVWQFVQQRPQSVPMLRIVNPPAQPGIWSGRHSIIEIVNDDMPFLVASVTAALSNLGWPVRSIIHPIVSVRREQGQLTSLSVTVGHTDDSHLESVMAIEVPRITDAAAIKHVEQTLLSVLADVRAAVTDWSDMRRHCVALSQQWQDSPNADYREAHDWLQWLAADHFTFLGYRRYQFSHDADRGEGHGELLIDETSGLGLLAKNDVSVFDGLRHFSELPMGVRDILLQDRPLIITKSNRPSSVHRAVPMDALIVRETDGAGALVAVHLFVGLFTSAAYSGSIRDIPYLRQKMTRIMEMAGFREHSHSGNALAHILDTYPRDELFQIDDAPLLETVQGILHLSEQPRLALFTRRDVFDRFVSCLIYLPRDRLDTDVRLRFQQLLIEVFNGTCQDVHITVDSSVLARIHYIITLKDPNHICDLDALEQQLSDMARLWSDRLQERLLAAVGDEQAARLMADFGTAFPPGYRNDQTADRAVADIQRMSELHEDRDLVVDLSADPAPHHDQSYVQFRIFSLSQSLGLSRVLPILENLGLEVLAEQPHQLRPTKGTPIWLQDFTARTEPMPGGNLHNHRAVFHDAFLRIWHAEAENDRFNRLVLRCGLSWRDVAMLRCYARYLRQTGFPLSQEMMADVLASYTDLTRQLVNLFMVMHDPDYVSNDRASGRDEAIGGLLVAIDHAFQHVRSLDEDRILRAFVNMIRFTLRTNFYQRDAHGWPDSWIAIKLASEKLDELPLPRPMVEIFLYAPRFEGVHLRGGKVARGGIRWSDRRDDFRTEILGLLKAQTVKNTVIVPVGAKGGFVLKHPPSEGGRDALQAEAIACYQQFIRGLLGITDNIIQGQIVPPPRVVRHDGDDPYLVVAADKGTATFSDIANAISEQFGFWLGDAFASGGSAGYDHKKMGITAKGGWESVKRHFREIGKDIQKTAFTCVGVGDMSGDVFGNGLLLSPHTKLIAAFNHVHIFVDPNPDPAKSFAERQRLFALPRSNWTDYDAAVLSEGGAIFERSAKSLTLSPQIQAVLGIERDKVTPFELMTAILCADVELIWFGGIGTYVKASHETHMDAGDKANDAIRINGRDLRAKVIGEGANLGMTQAARIEGARTGIRMNTDFIDNSAGVDCSDHEVNIKILLRDVIQHGKMDRPTRDTLLESMTDEVSRLVLLDNYLQTEAITIALADAPKRLMEHGHIIKVLERDAGLVRALEGLPDDDGLAQRQRDGAGLTRPEFAIVMAYAKMNLFNRLVNSTLPDDPYFVQDLIRYFPRHLRTDEWRDAIMAHPLRREIIATTLANSFVNRAGPTIAIDLAERTGMDLATITLVFAIVKDVFDLRDWWRAIEQGDNVISAEAQAVMFRWIIRLIERACIWILSNVPQPFDATTLIERFQPGVRALRDMLRQQIPDANRAEVRAIADYLVAAGTPDALAQDIATIPLLFAAFDIVRCAEQVTLSVADAARIYFMVGDRLGTAWLRLQAVPLSSANLWRRQAVAAIIDDLYACQRDLAIQILSLRTAGKVVDETVLAAWIEGRPHAVARLDHLIAELHAINPIDFAMLAVANRQLKALMVS